MDSYIFSGFGYSLGEYLITNKEIEDALKKSYLTGFNFERIAQSENYQKAKRQRPDLTEFEYFAEIKMGFKTRNHVVPFPPTKEKLRNARNSLDLAVEASEKAINQSGINPEKIDAWLVSSATPHEQAPGIAATLKAYFVSFENQTPTMTLTSACVGFNYNLERALLYFKNHPEAKHLLICHTEVMSGILTEQTDFVGFTTFADAAGAVVLSRIETNEPEGVLSIKSYEDLNMVNYLGASKKGNLYMHAGIVKNRATQNIVNTSKELLEELKTELKNVDIIIPHQTGNAIVHGVIDEMQLPFEKVYQEVQYNHGNLSGASIPVSLAKLNEEGRLHTGETILTAVAGLGGEYGGFVYKVPSKTLQKEQYKSLKNKNCLLTGITGGIGSAVAESLAKKSCNIVGLYNSNDNKAENIKKHLEEKYNVIVDLYKTDFSDKNSISATLNKITEKHKSINYLVHTAAITGSLERAGNISTGEYEMVMQVNYLSAVAITKAIVQVLKETVLYLGSVAEDAEFSGSSSYVASKRALHGFAASFAQELVAKGVRSIYYMPGVIETGMASKLNDMQKAASKQLIGQQKDIQAEEIAERIVKSLYIPKVKDVYSYYESVLTVRRDRYNYEDIHYSITK